MTALAFRSVGLRKCRPYASKKTVESLDFYQARPGSRQNLPGSLGI